MLCDHRCSLFSLFISFSIFHSIISFRTKVQGLLDNHQSFSKSKILSNRLFNLNSVIVFINSKIPNQCSQENDNSTVPQNYEGHCTLNYRCLPMPNSLLGNIQNDMYQVCKFITSFFTNNRQLFKNNGKNVFSKY